jgi:hypothetical protein
MLSTSLEEAKLLAGVEDSAAKLAVAVGVTFACGSGGTA